jgi:hypothetical protein
MDSRCHRSKRLSRVEVGPLVPCRRSRSGSAAGIKRLDLAAAFSIGEDHSPFRLAGSFARRVSEVGIMRPQENLSMLGALVSTGVVLCVLFGSGAGPASAPLWGHLFRKRRHPDGRQAGCRTDGDHVPVRPGASPGEDNPALAERRLFDGGARPPEVCTRVARVQPPMRGLASSRTPSRGSRHPRFGSFPITPPTGSLSPGIRQRSRR